MRKKEKLILLLFRKFFSKGQLFHRTLGSGAILHISVGNPIEPEKKGRGRGGKSDKGTFAARSFTWEGSAIWTGEEALLARLQKGRKEHPSVLKKGGEKREDLKGNGEGAKILISLARGDQKVSIILPTKERKPMPRGERRARCLAAQQENRS